MYRDRVLEENSRFIRKVDMRPWQWVYGVSKEYQSCKFWHKVQWREDILKKKIRDRINYHDIEELLCSILN